MLRRILLSIYIAYFFSVYTNCFAGQVAEEPYTLDIIDIPEDLLKPGWSIWGPGCVYSARLPDYYCEGNVTVEKDVEGVGFWTNCQRNVACGITYTRQPGEVIEEVELVGHYDKKHCRPRSQIGYVDLQQEGTFSRSYYAGQSDGLLNLSSLVVPERINYVSVRVWQLNDCPDSYYFIDKIIVHKKREATTLIDVEHDLITDPWRVSGCVYQENPEFTCNGKNFSHTNPGKGFWTGCGQSCTFFYDNLPGVKLRSLEVHPLVNNVHMQIWFTLKSSQTTYHFLIRGASPWIIDLDDFVPANDEVELITLSVPSSLDEYWLFQEILDKLILRKTLPAIQ